MVRKMGKLTLQALLGMVLGRDTPNINSDTIDALRYVKIHFPCVSWSQKHSGTLKGQEEKNSNDGHK